jgi:hypothetical protein
MKNLEKKIPNSLIEIAGGHFVVSQLSLRRLVALPTNRNTRGIDILVSEPEAKGMVVLQVKTSLKKVKFWPTCRPDNCLKGPHSFYVFLRSADEMGFKAFLEGADSAVKQVKKNLEEIKRLKHKEFPYLCRMGIA